jgi:nicotinate-nucleotide adenylyltransferase
MEPSLYDGALRSGARIGLLGGSFNPAHEGHRHISLVALKHLALDHVWWLVTPQNPLKPASNTQDLDERIKQALRLATHPRITVTNIERKLGTRYTIDTLNGLKSRYPAAHFVWVMGADNFVQLPQWRSWNEIMSAVPVAVIARPQYHLASGLSKAAIRYRSHRLKPHLAPKLVTLEPPAWTLIIDYLHLASSTKLRKAIGSDRG